MRIYEAKTAVSPSLFPSNTEKWTKHGIWEALYGGDCLATLLRRVSVGSGDQLGDDTLLLQPTEPYCHSAAYVCVSRKEKEKRAVQWRRFFK